MFAERALENIYVLTLIINVRCQSLLCAKQKILSINPITSELAICKDWALIINKVG